MNHPSKESNFANVVKKILARCRMNHGEYMKVSVIAEVENCEKRRIYDLFNVMCSLGLCAKSANKSYSWLGEANMMKTIQQEYERMETLSVSQDMWSIFKLPDSPPIGQLTIMTILAFIFFGKDEMNLKQVCLSMAQKRSRVSGMLRRLYLSAFFLEHLGIITHSSNVGSYILNIDTKSIVSQTFRNMKARMVFPINSIASQLQRIDDNYIHEIKLVRYEMLQQKMRAAHIIITPLAEIDQDQALSPDTLSPVKMVEIF